MRVKTRGITAFNPLFLLLVIFSISPITFSAENQPRNSKKPNLQGSDYRLGSSAIFQVQGNVYPLGHYTVSLNLGHPPKLYDFDIDSGSDLTWVQCDAPCKGCTKPHEQLYRPNNNLVQCVDQLCAGIHLSSMEYKCAAPDDQCDYEVEYADNGSSLGVLVRDYVSFRFTNGSVVRPRIGFGCGYDQKFSGPTSPPSTAGVLGLGRGKASFLSQLHSLGLIRNVVGHCLSAQGGFLFFGDDFITSPGIVWTPMSPSSLEKHYNSGPAELFFNGKPTSVDGLDLIFDSGSSYTYFSSQAYQAVVDLVSSDLKGKLQRATNDPSLPLCWKGSKSFKSLSDIKKYFKPITLSFTKSTNSQLQLPPEAYLIVTKHGNVCLGILDGTEVGLENLNIIGDISLQDKMVIYDNEKEQIGWISANCDRLSDVDRDNDEGFPHQCTANLGIFADRCPVRERYS